MAQVPSRSCGCPVPGNVQGPAGQGLEKPGSVEGVPTHGSAAGMNDI